MSRCTTPAGASPGARFLEPLELGGRRVELRPEARGVSSLPIERARQDGEQRHHGNGSDRPVHG